MGTSPDRLAGGASGGWGCRVVLLVGMVTSWLAGGCLPPPEMHLCDGSDSRRTAGVWWSADRDDVLRGPIIGVEQRLSGTQVRQWLIDDRGARCFEYRHGKLCGWSTPAPTRPLGVDFAVVRSLARSCFGFGKDAGWPGPPLPRQEVDRLTGTADLAVLLERHWADARRDPPPGMTAHEIEQAMGAADLTVGDLLEVTK